MPPVPWPESVKRSAGYCMQVPTLYLHGVYGERRTLSSIESLSVPGARLCTTHDTRSALGSANSSRALVCRVSMLLRRNDLRLSRLHLAV